ncbi:MAG: YebC/PmpR family DNA-binding transcriptional regulator [Thermodesulfobacteriota bacterium]
MAGHSKWANIKHKKMRTDAKRGKIFSKLVKEIMVAAKMGGSDPSSNARLRTSIDKAKSENLPADNIERAIKKGAGELQGVSYEEGLYEGYGPGGVALLVSFMTDNKNRTASEVRYAFNKGNGNLGADGSVAWIFESKGFITISMEGSEEDAILEAALEAGAEDVVANTEDNVFEITTEPVDFLPVKDALAKAGFEFTVAETLMIPKNTIMVEGKIASQLIRLIDALEDLDDVQNVYANFDMSAEDMEEASN